jgi:transglutaminase-like putative cysteine protease
LPLIPESSDLTYYLGSSRIIDFYHPRILKTAADLSRNIFSDVALVKTVYEFVRDQISHSHDINAEKVTCKASEVLKYGHGLCFAKSYLLAAILRYLNIPTGFCYQKVRNISSKLVLHGLNAVHLKSADRWIRLDARGNKEGINARFNIEKETLAYSINEELGERDYETIYFYPNEDIVNAFKKYKIVTKLLDNIPVEI